MDKNAREVPAVLRRWRRMVDAERREPQPLPDVLRGWQAAREAESEAWKAYDEAMNAALPKIIDWYQRAQGDFSRDDVRRELDDIWAAIPPRPRPVTAIEIALTREMWAQIEAEKTAARDQ